MAMVVNQNTVHRALVMLGEVSSADCTEEQITDRIVDLLVLAADAGFEWYEILSGAERHAVAEIDSPDDLELATRAAEAEL